jgi:hypothetical protein
MAGVNGKYPKVNYIIQNGFVSDDEIIKDIMTKWDEEYGATIVYDTDGNVLFICECGGIFMDKICTGEIELKFNSLDKQ